MSACSPSPFSSASCAAGRYEVPRGRHGARYRMKATRRSFSRSSCTSRWSPGPYKEHDADMLVSSSPVTLLTCNVGN